MKKMMDIAAASSRRVCSMPSQDSRPSEPSCPESPKPSLFGIPGEIRNIIYRHVIAGDIIHITYSPFPEPAILRTYRELRREVLDIYCLENKLIFHCTNWDHTYV